MDFELLRFSSGVDSTVGAFYSVDGSERKFLAFSLEDEHREVKVKSETRIPAGKYRLRQREEPTPLTQKYRSRYDWFDWHIEVMDVPNFTSIYIHIGNTDDSSAGCILIGDSAINNQIKGQESGFIGHSTQAFRRIYGIINRAISDGPVSLNIKNIG